MLFALAKGAVGAVALLLGWVAIETAWRRVFARELASPEGRGCSGCMVCSRRCERSEEQEQRDASVGRTGR